MPIEIRRFGVGNRRPDPLPGTVGVTHQVIHADEHGLVAELAFSRGALVEPHGNPNPTWFVVIEGGGWVGVGDERTRIAAGEAVLWPADVPHGAWTEHSEMRVIMVEFSDPDHDGTAATLAGRVRAALPADATVARGEGSLRDESGRRTIDPEAGEPA